MMRVKKIISGAQTGADRAALDFAIEYELPYGGWVPAGRKAEDGVIPDHYSVWEMASGDYQERTEWNVMDSEGTLILSHGELTGGSLLTRELAEKHGRPCLHIDFSRTLGFDAAIDINDWISEHGIEVLNIAGPRASKDAEIYPAVFKILETVFYISIISDAMPDFANRSHELAGNEDSGQVFPINVKEALDTLIEQLSPKIKVKIASMPDDQLSEVGISLGRGISEQFGLNKGNQKLLDACRVFSGKPNLDADGAAMLIVRELWRRLKKIGHLRVIK
ncbi:MAG: putative molybdenum carrier protein [Desulfobacterales bacterium]|nr:putative molybdenum carrier protein [Desulfobacterales bacterium]